MAGYRDEEIEAAVSRFVQSTIRIERDALGPVDVGSKFNEVLHLFSSTLIYDPNAIFYVIYLATNKLNVSVELALEYIDDIDTAIDEMGYYTKDVTRTTLLGDAAAALLTVDQILTDKSVISSRAFTRYQQAVDEFIQVSIEPNIKQSGQVIRPPQLARQTVLATISNLSALYEDVLATLTQIRLMLSEFNSLNLGVLSIQNSVQKVRDDLRDLQSQFESSSTDRDYKISLCRDAYLSIASGKAVLNNFTTVSDPSDPRLVSSTAIVGRPAVPLGDDGELIPASVTSTNSAPWEVSASTDELKVSEDGGAEKTYVFSSPTQPSVLSGPSPYGIVTGTSDLLEIDGLPVVTLTASAKDAAEVANDINVWAAAGPYPYTAAPVTLSGVLCVQITKTTPGATEIRMTAEDVTFRDKILDTYAEVGFYEGESDSSTGLSAAEAASELNAQGYVTAEIARTLYESGDSTGTIADTLYMTLSLNTIEETGHTGDMLLIRSGINAGYRRIVSVSRVGGVDRVTISSDTPFKKTGTTESWIILSEQLKIVSKAADLTTLLEIGAGNINSVMGFSAGTSAGTTTGFRAAEDGVDMDFSRLDVVEGDIIRIAHTEGSTVYATEHEILELTTTNQQLEISPAIGTDWTIDSFRILSAAAVEYETLVSALEAWDAVLSSSEFSEDILELQRVMNPLIANKNPSISQLNDAKSTLQSLEDILTHTSPDGLTEILEAFQVGLVPRIDAALKMLKERGMDRAYDLLMKGEISTFFGMDKDDASSSSYMLKSMRSIVQSDLRVSKLDDDGDDTSLDHLSIGTDPNYDYSDADSDENVKLLGKVPDYSEADAGRTSRSRY